MLLRAMSFLQGLFSWLGSIFADPDSPHESNGRRNPNSSAMEGSAPDTSVVNERVVHLPVSRVNDRVVYKLKGYFDLAKQEIKKAIRADEGSLIDDAISHYRNAQLILGEGALTRAPSYITPSKQQKVKCYHRKITEWQDIVAKRLQSLSQQRGGTIPDKVCTGLTKVQITRLPPQAPRSSQRPANSAKDVVPRRPSFGGNSSGTKAHTCTTGASKSNRDSDCHDTKLVEMINTVIIDRSPSVKWNAVAGLDKAKQTLFEMVILPTKRRDLFTGLRRPPRGLLLFGPPGNGKTMLAKAVASQCNATFFNVSASSLTSKWVGEGEKLVRTLFMVAISRQPSVIFMDEIDSIMSTRVANEHDASRRLKSEFLVQFDGVTSNRDDLVVVIGATNKPQELDDAVLRRLVKRIYVPLPDQNVRSLFLQQNLEGERKQIKGGDLKKLARETEGYSGSDLQALCEEAAMMPIREHGSNALTVKANEVRPIRKDDFRRAMTAIRPSIQKRKWEEVERWNEEFGSLCGIERWNDFRSVSDPISKALVTSKCWVSRASRTAIPFSIINYFFLYIFLLCTVFK